MCTALQGLFTVDTLLRQAHGFYSLSYIEGMFNRVTRGHAARSYPHPQNFMAGMVYASHVEIAERKGWLEEILHKHILICNIKMAHAQST